MKKILFFLLLLLCMLSVLNSQDKITKEFIEKKKQVKKTEVNNHWKKIALNNLEMWFSNNGMSSHNPVTGNAGLTFPKGSGKGLVYADGPILAGMVGDSVRLIGSTYRTALQPGPSIQGVDPDDPQYKIYIIRKDWQELKDGELFMSGPNYTKSDYERDYKEWQIDMGAPYELDGTGKKVPKFIGDEQAWYIMNDFDINKSTAFYGSASCGTEWHTLVWSYNSPETLVNIIFKKYTIINKGSHDIENAYLSCFSDTEIGSPEDDLVGCDTNLNLGYAYNGTDFDAIYGYNSPAIGYIYLQGPAVKSDKPNETANWNFGKKSGYKNLDMTSFVFFANSNSYFGNHNWLDPNFNYEGALDFYNLIEGLGKTDSNPWINEQTGESTRFVFSGDPVTGDGWNSKHIGDVSITMSSGPFTFAVGDTQEVVFAIVVGQGADRLSSITVMKEYALIAKKAYDEYCGTAQTIAVKKPEDIPTEYTLSQNYPNPFNPSTIIKYQMPEAAHISLKVYDVMGKEVATLVNSFQNSGSYDITFNAKGLASGIYFYKLNANGKQFINKMLLMK